MTSAPARVGLLTVSPPTPAKLNAESRQEVHGLPCYFPVVTAGRGHPATRSLGCREFMHPLPGRQGLRAQEAIDLTQPKPCSFAGLFGGEDGRPLSSPPPSKSGSSRGGAAGSLEASASPRRVSGSAGGAAGSLAALSSPWSCLSGSRWGPGGSGGACSPVVFGLAAAARASSVLFAGRRNVASSRCAISERLWSVAGSSPASAVLLAGGAACSHGERRCSAGLLTPGTHDNSSASLTSGSTVRALRGAGGCAVSAVADLSV